MRKVTYRAQRKKTSWLHVLAGLPFVAFGLFMFGTALLSIGEWVSVRDWHETPAMIVSADKKVVGKSIRTTATYRYIYNGIEYRGERVAIGEKFGSSDPLYRQLEKYRLAGQPFRCYVNQDRPEQAVLYRTLRWKTLAFFMVFAAAFSFVGFGLIFGFFDGQNKVQSQQWSDNGKMAQLWRENPQWRTGRIRSRNRSEMFFWTGFALIFNSLAWPIAYIVIDAALNKQSYGALIALIFLLIGLWLAYKAVISFLRWFKFGESTFVMKTLPGVIGGPLRGRVETTLSSMPKEDVRLWLECFKSTLKTENFGGTELLSQQVQLVNIGRLSRGPKGYIVPVEFAVPFDEPQTSSTDRGKRIYWRLRAQASVSGVDYVAAFEVPVFKT